MTVRARARAGLLLLPLLACGGEGNEPNTPATGSTRVLLTDAPFPFDRVERVDVYILSVSGSVSPDTLTAGNFVTLATPNRRINLLDLQNGITDELGSVDLPEGVITAVRLVIDTDSSSIRLKDGRTLDASSSPGIQWQSSAGKPVLNALIHEQIAVPDTGGVVVIDFDVGQAFIPVQEINPGSTDSSFIFSPVFRAADGNRTGSITGVIEHGGAPLADASLRLYFGNPADPENTWFVLGTAHSDANGEFKFSYVTQSSWWALNPLHAGKTYNVAVDPPATSGFARNVVNNVTVTGGSETSIGTVELP
jgi:hypothetical protein